MSWIKKSKDSKCAKVGLPKTFGRKLQSTCGSSRAMNMLQSVMQNEINENVLPLKSRLPGKPKHYDDNQCADFSCGSTQNSDHLYMSTLGNTRIRMPEDQNVLCNDQSTLLPPKKKIQILQNILLAPAKSVYGVEEHASSSAPSQYQDNHETPEKEPGEFSIEQEAIRDTSPSKLLSILEKRVSSSPSAHYQYDRETLERENKLSGFLIAEEAINASPSEQLNRVDQQVLSSAPTQYQAECKTLENNPGEFSTADEAISDASPSKLLNRVEQQASSSGIIQDQAERKTPENKPREFSISDETVRNKSPSKLLNRVEQQASSSDTVQYQSERDTPENDPTNFSIAEGGIGDPGPSKLLTRWKKARPELWKKNIAKQKRSKCEPYTTKKTERPAKMPKEVDCSKCVYKCQDTFTPEERIDYCKAYWSLNFNRQRDFILTYVKSSEPKYRSNIKNHKRSSARTYTFLKNYDCVRVCKSFFEKTLCISNGPVLNAFRGLSESGIFIKGDRRGKNPPANKRSDYDMAIVRQHIESFPKMESHYLRKKSKKQYLDKNLNITKMYNLYLEFCKVESNASTPISLTSYRRFFCTKYNYSFFHPKKDQCPVCDNYDRCKTPDQKLQMEVAYQEHQTRKNDCYTAKELDKVRAKADSTFVTCTFDLQGVLQIPKSEVSQFYYSRKICVYNLTVYEGASGKGFCFCWNELNGKRGSSEVGTALFKWLEGLPQEVKQVSLFSDTCGGQNRNKNIAVLLLFAVQNLENLDVIEHKFLESGHSFMECDSMHSAIEGESKNKSVFGMSGWLEIFKNARSKKPKAGIEEYKVQELKFNDILDLQSLSNAIIKNRLKDENGSTIKWLKIKAMRYEKNLPGIIQYRYDHNSSYIRINVYGRGAISSRRVINKAYSNMLPISNLKKNDLLRLCSSNAIPEEYHAWYRMLPSQSSVLAERLPEPNLTDDESERE